VLQDIAPAAPSSEDEDLESDDPIQVPSSSKLKGKEKRTIEEADDELDIIDLVRSVSSV
jgi:hypothetical protein